jgi:hypothetical protein
MGKVINRKTDHSVALTHEPRDYRKELWVQIAVAVARAENCRDKRIPAAWADQALADFDKTFKENPNA